MLGAPVVLRHGAGPLTLVVAEDARFEWEMSSHVIAMAFAQQEAWRKDRIFTTVLINISEGQLKDPNFPKLLEGLFTAHKPARRSRSA